MTKSSWMPSRRSSLPPGPTPSLECRIGSLDPQKTPLPDCRPTANPGIHDVDNSTSISGRVAERILWASPATAPNSSQTPGPVRASNGSVELAQGTRKLGTNWKGF